MMRGVAATRTPIGKAPRGMFKNVRPDDMLAHATQQLEVGQRQVLLRTE